MHGKQRRPTYSYSWWRRFRDNRKGKKKKMEGDSCPKEPLGVAMSVGSNKEGRRRRIQQWEGGEEGGIGRSSFRDGG